MKKIRMGKGGAPPPPPSPEGRGLYRGGFAPCTPLRGLTPHDDDPQCVVVCDRPAPLCGGLRPTPRIVPNAFLGLMPHTPDCSGHTSGAAAPTPFQAAQMCGGDVQTQHCPLRRKALGASGHQNGAFTNYEANRKRRHAAQIGSGDTPRRHAAHAPAPRNAAPIRPASLPSLAMTISVFFGELRV